MAATVHDCVHTPGFSEVGRSYLSFFSRQLMSPHRFSSFFYVPPFLPLSRLRSPPSEYVSRSEFDPGHLVLDISTSLTILHVDFHVSPFFFFYGGQVNYTRKVQHFAAYLVPLLFSPSPDCDCKGTLEVRPCVLPLLSFLLLHVPSRKDQHFIGAIRPCPALINLSGPVEDKLS